MQDKAVKMIKLICSIISICFSCSLYAAPTPEQIREAIASKGVDGFIKYVSAIGAKNLPQRVDSEIEVTSLSALPKEMHFNNRLIKREKSDIADIELYKKSSIIRSANFLCSSPVSNILINEYDVKYTYSLYSKTHKFVFKYTIDKYKCQ